MAETGIIISIIACIFTLSLCVKTNIGKWKKIVIGGVLLLFIAFPLIVRSRSGREAKQSTDDTLLQTDAEVFSDEEDMPSGFTENKERNREEGILYTIDDREKVTLTSHNGEICVKIPRWEGFSTEQTNYIRHEKLRMTHAENSDNITYELIAAWDREEVGEEIAADLAYDYVFDNVLGDIYHMTVEGIEIYYRPCYEFTHSRWIEWHYVVWADLGCGQFLKTEIQQRSLSDEARERAYHYETVPQEVTEPLNIEGMIEALYTNIEVYTSEGDPIPVAYRESLPKNEEKAYYDFSFGIVREYKTDEYRESTVCSELIESLYEAMRTDTMENLLQQGTLAGKEMSIAEKMDYIKKEETGTLIRYDAGHANGPGGTYPPTQYYLMKGADASEEYLVYSIFNHWEERFDYMWFRCEKDGDGPIRAQRGIYVFGADTGEYYFLSCQGVPYLCIVNRDSKEKIESVVLYDFETPDLIGTVIRIDEVSVRLCSYIRNEDTYGTLKPWYLYSNYSKEFLAMLKRWEITEFLGEDDALQVEDTGSAAYERAQKRTQDLVDTYLGREINMSWDRKQHDVKSFQNASVYGYYYTSLENLYKVYRQPETLAMEAPICAATLEVRDFDDKIDILMDKNGRAAICVEGRFFLLEKSEEETEELRTWE